LNNVPKRGLDTSEGWRLFQLTASALANLHQTASLLAALDQAHGRNVGPVLPDFSGFQRMRFRGGTDIITAAGEPTRCYLVESGIASLCLGEPDGVEVGIVGPGGVAGIWNLLGERPRPLRVVATTDCRTVQIPTREFANLLVADIKGLQFLHAEVAKEWAEAMVIAHCNAEHTVRQRVSRWILTAVGRLNGPIGPISHDRMAGLLGVRRASVTVALHELEGEEAIRSRRYFIEVRERSALERLSCDCHVLLARTEEV
jgi:CRP-like cAMP-binding protein